MKVVACKRWESGKPSCVAQSATSTVRLARARLQEAAAGQTNGMTSLAGAGQRRCTARLVHHDRKAPRTNRPAPVDHAADSADLESSAV